VNKMVMGAKAKRKPESDHWQTPAYILDAVNGFYGGDWFDPCPASSTFDGLSMPWNKPVYVNPPFSNYLEWATHGIKQQVEQIWMCHHSHDTRWFKLLLEGRGSALLLLKERVKFIDPKTGKPGGTAIGKCQTLIYTGPRFGEFRDTFKSLGYLLI
jgi:hypothetical protein